MKISKVTNSKKEGSIMFIDKVALFKGNKITEMSKGELIEAVCFLSNLLEIEKQEHKRQLDILTEARKNSKGFFSRLLGL